LTVSAPPGLPPDQAAAWWHESATLRALSRIRHRYREGRAAIPLADRNAWLVLIGVGAVGMLVLMVVLMLGGQWLAETGRLDWEPAFLLWLGEHGPFRFSSAVFFQTFGTDITLIILISATALTAAWNRRPITAVSIVLAPLVVDLIGRVGWMMWDRARPDLLHEGIASPGFHSFPSGHTSKTIAIYGFLTLLLWRASRSVVERLLALIIVVFISTVVPIGRMTMGVHWPSDVIAGAILGIAWIVVLGWGLRYERAATGQITAAGRQSPPPSA
jgi:membrane-associated phospholipid phosphatase